MRYQQIKEYCRPCLERLARQAISLGCGENEENLSYALMWLDELYDENTPPPIIASKLHHRVKKVCRNDDPYSPLKEKEIALAQNVSSELRKNFKDEFDDLMCFSLLGNAIDFFRPLEELEQAFRQGVTLALNDLPKIEKRLDTAEKILLLTDNAGEVFFDLPLLSWFKENGFEIYYVVKPKPIQNDLSLQDLKRLGMGIPAKVITTGAEMVGLDLSLASDEFRHLYHEADLVLAKGMGHFETLSVFPGREELVFMLCAKCVPVAKALEVPQNSYVILFENFS